MPKKPIAPKIYRPQPVPLVLQRKTKTAAPVYRPQPVPKVLQRKESQSPTRYSGLTSQVLQPKFGPKGLSAGNVIQRMEMSHEKLVAQILANPEVDGHAKALLRGGFMKLARLSGARNEFAILEEHGEGSFSGTRTHTYYRALSKEEFRQLVATNQLPLCNGYQGLSPTQDYSEDYLSDNPYLVQFLCDEDAWADIMQRCAVKEKPEKGIMSIGLGEHNSRELFSKEHLAKLERQGKAPEKAINVFNEYLRGHMEWHLVKCKVPSGL